MGADLLFRPGPTFLNPHQPGYAAFGSSSLAIMNVVQFYKIIVGPMLPLLTWFLALHLMAQAKKNVSAL